MTEKTDWVEPESIPFSEVKRLLDSLSVCDNAGDVWDAVEGFCTRTGIPFEEDWDNECWYLPWQEREDD